jgi:hypothetical protein
MDIQHNTTKNNKEKQISSKIYINSEGHITAMNTAYKREKK